MSKAGASEASAPLIPRQWVDFEKSIGPRIRIARLSRGMGLAQLAQRLGISYQQLHKYEVGANRISIARLAHIGEILGVQLIDLLLLPLDPATMSQPPDGERLMAARLIEHFGKIRTAEARELVCKLAASLAEDAA